MQLRAVILFCKMHVVYLLKTFLDVLNVTLNTDLTAPWPSIFNDPLEYCWQSDSQLTTGFSNFRLIKKIFIKWSLTIG